MEKLQFEARPPGLSFPDESQCSVCGYFDIRHPDVRRILEWREAKEKCPPGTLFNIAQCKCQATADKRLRDEAQRRAQAHLPHDSPRTFANFLPRDIPPDALGDVRRFADLEGRRCILLQGKTGCGKSHLLEAIGRHVLDHSGWSVRYETSSGLLDRLRSTFEESSRESVYDVLRWYQRQHVFLLDDLGTRAEKDWAIQELTDLVDERIRNGLWLAVATNLVRDEMAEAVGDRIASRLYQVNEELHEVSRVTITASDYRGLRREE